MEFAVMDTMVFHESNGASMYAEQSYSEEMRIEFILLPLLCKNDSQKSILTRPDSICCACNMEKGNNKNTRNSFFTMTKLKMMFMLLKIGGG